MDNQRLTALEQRVTDLEQKIKNQQQDFDDCTKNLVSDIKNMSKYFNLAMPELITAIRVLRREI